VDYFWFVFSLSIYIYTSICVHQTVFQVMTLYTSSPENPFYNFLKRISTFLGYLLSVLIPFLYFQITIVKTFYSASIKHVDMSTQSSSKIHNLNNLKSSGKTATFIQPY
jgi:hypothetical protein